MNPTDNRLIVDLNKVSTARLRYVTHAAGLDHRRNNKPTTPTVNNIPISEGERLYGSDILLLAIAKKKGIIDKWEAELTLQLHAGSRIKFTGQKALSIYDAWCAKIFKQRK